FSSSFVPFLFISIGCSPLPLSTPMLSRALPLLRSSPSLRLSSFSLRRSLHKGVDSTPPIRFTSQGEKSLIFNRLYSSSPSSSFSFLTPSKKLELMQATDVVSLNSRDPRDKDGCIVVSAIDGSTLATGWNQPTRGMEKSIQWNIDPIPKELIVDEEWTKSKYPYMLHAEQSALFEARKAIKGDKVVYTTLFPCFRCAKHIVAGGDVRKVIFLNDRLEDDTYQASREILSKGGVIVERASDIPDNVHLQEALEVAKKSPDTRTKVGSIVVCAETAKIIASGYNAPSKGYSAEDIDWNPSRPRVHNTWIESKLPFIQHSGVMALLEARAKSDGPKVLCFKQAPCHECAITMVAGDDVVKVLYRIPPKGESQKAAMEILKRAGIKVEQLVV
ncbi:hypothetical protein PFISCL1PPCAC_19354, partial [Pristionchus fissidentatus]